MLRGDALRVILGGREILRGVSIDVRSGGLTGVIGPNGSGKTTLLRTLAGIVQASAGTVTFNGRSLRDLSRKALARQLAVVPQETHLALDYSVLEIVLMGRYPHLGPFEFEGADDLASAHAALRATGTGQFAERAFATLSGGEKQRVIIASALAQLGEGTESESTAGRVLLLDEPTASLDLRYQLEVAALLQRLHQRGDITIVLSTHDLAFAQRVCSDFVLLAEGQVLAHGPAADVLTPARIAALYGISEELARPFVARALDSAVIDPRGAR